MGEMRDAKKNVNDETYGQPQILLMKCFTDEFTKKIDNFIEDTNFL